MSSLASSSAAPVVRVVAVEAFERPFALRLPFRFGLHTLTKAVQAVVRLTIELPSGHATGFAAEVLLPKWFDKRPEFSPADNEAQLRRSLQHAIAAYLSNGPSTAFSLFANCYGDLTAQAEAEDQPPLVAGFGPALLDRAIVDALCRHFGCSFDEAMRQNIPGLRGHAIAPDMSSFDFDKFLGTRRPSEWLHARHTVGMLDALEDGEVAFDPGDGLPVSLAGCVRHYGNTHFKLKLSGDVAWDIDRLTRIARVLDRSAQRYYATLDGNEQYRDVEALMSLWQEIASLPALERLVASTLLIEQPIPRSSGFDMSVEQMSKLRPVIIDESDGTLDALPLARLHGYRGVSTKSCKGLYKSLINAARCEAWNVEAGPGHFFMSAEDLITQSGLSVQQDMMLAAFLGISHIERNAHHYVSGMATCGTEEAQAFVAAHADLYEDSPPRMRVDGGRLALSSCRSARGFATSIVPVTEHDMAMVGIE